MPVFGVGKVHRIWTPKGGPPKYARAEAVDGPEVLPNLKDCNQQKHIGLVVEIFSGTCRQQSLSEVWAASVASGQRP